MYKLVPTILAALLLSQAHAARLFKRKYHNLVQCEGQKETDVNEAMTQSQNFADMIANKWKPGKYGSGSSNFGNGYQATMDKYMAIDTYKGYLIYTCPAVEQVVEDGNAHECQALAECYTCSAIALWMQETYGFATVPEWGEWQPGTSEYLTMFNELTGGNITDPNAFQNFGHAPYDNPADQPTSTPTTSARPAPTMPMRLLSCDYTATPTPSCMCGNSTVSVSQTVHDGSTYSYCAYETYKYPIDPPGKFVPTTLGTGSQQPVSKTSMAALPPATSNSTVSSAKCPKGNLYTDGTSCDTDCAEKGGECVPLTPVAYGQSPPVTQQITCVCP
ncbi:hypothetical protein MMC21_007196 [Puttea exsequens]|nr:hypothetical protein [Puttea exsequens]